ncbi:MAG: hypothetical protein JXQ65_10455 [Candidatus Marinimicrobia bacterium]|nr:hypothetical protein [Candidatus Neomarinimicrobiota bacterium]
MKVSLKKQKEYRQRLVAFFKEQGFTVVLGKGSFHQGTCLVQQDKKIVINGFLPVDMQVKFLVETAEAQHQSDKVPDEIIKFGKSVG